MFCRYTFKMRVLISITVITAIILFSSAGSGIASGPEHEKSSLEQQRAADRFHKKMSGIRAQRYIDSIKPWLVDNGYSTSLMFIADMSLPMNIKRFYVVNPDSQKLLASFLVAHGNGRGSTIDKAVFSNTPGSLCSSEGRYEIGGSYYGNYGKSYRLLGLDASNSNAFDRAIVFHSFKDQTDEEYSMPNYFSSGCPMIARPSFEYCDSLIQLQEQPVMLVIYK